MYKLIARLLLFISPLIIEGQSISGQITDDKHTPISNAYILSQAGTIHSHSDEQGYYELDKIRIGDTLKVSFLGFKDVLHVLGKEDIEDGVDFHLEEIPFELQQVYITGNLNAISEITSIDLQLNPVSSSQEILTRVPGLFISQHAGGGKAEQIFLRGFDIDHGTDVAITVDGMPVNMVSHAHGQGYADLHFLIPETVENIDFGKGPYSADHGNLNTAGYIDFKTKDKLENSTIGFEVGDFSTLRSFALVNLLDGKSNQNAYIATEFLSSNGPFESPQDFIRANLMVKYIRESGNGDRISLLASRFTSRWNASGQIPQRLVGDGEITRFGSVDDTEGGVTSRTNFSIDHSKVISEDKFIMTRAYYSLYDFDLFSNFTFFLYDPINGDQIRQSEERAIMGFNTTLFGETVWSNNQIKYESGIGIRYDDVDNVGLWHTLNRETILERFSYGNVNEINISAFTSLQYKSGDWIINPGVRMDYFDFHYHDLIATNRINATESKSIISPKLNIQYSPTHHWQFYLKSGIGFHSNDTRVVVAQQGQEILPSAFGIDAGFIWQIVPRLWLNSGLWYLSSQQEFVYVGDEAIVEPSGRSRRKGVEFSMRLQLSDNLFMNTDVNYTHARSIDDEEGNNLIPLAPDLTSTGGLAFKHPNGFSTRLNYRYIKDRPANENNSITAEGYFVTELASSFEFNKVVIGLSIDNLFDSEWNEAQFATESRLQNEGASVEELHFTPGVSRYIKGSVSFKF